MSTDRVLQIRVPAPLTAEAPSSWISRLTLAQGCSLREMLEFLNLPVGTDLDLALHGPALAELRRKCSLPPTAFAIADSIMSKVVQAGLGNEVLCRDGGRKPRFRYCPLCLKEGNPSAFQIYWRFLDWRHCPVHHCLMENNCWKCRQPARFPRDMEVSPAGRNGHGSQRRCQRCTADLSDAVPCMLDPERLASLSRIESHWLYAGTEIVAALTLPQPATPEDPSPALRRALEIDCLPTTNQAYVLERWIRAMNGLANPPRQGRPEYYAKMRRNWGARVFRFARYYEEMPAPGIRGKPRGKKRQKIPQVPRLRPTVAAVQQCCDRCGALSQPNVESGFNEFLQIGFDAGRASEIGHGTRVDIALCHCCLIETLGPWLRLTASDWRRLRAKSPLPDEKGGAGLEDERPRRA